MKIIKATVLLALVAGFTSAHAVGCKDSTNENLTGVPRVNVPAYGKRLLPELAKYESPSQPGVQTVDATPTPAVPVAK